jgi:hypothetical protein
MLALCFLAVFAAIAGLGAVGIALGTASLATPALLAAPAFGATSLVCGLAAAVLALRREGRGFASAR